MRVLASAVVTVGFAIVLLCAGASFQRADAADTWGACCLPHGSCLDNYDSTSCSNIGGSYQGDSTECSLVTCEPVPCGESESPVCGGTCPPGQRCIDTENLNISISVTLLFAQDGGKAQDCRCVDVSCGGVPLGNGQGCCAGVPFTIGVQGCCNGEVVQVDMPCNCGQRIMGGTSVETQFAPIDLRDTGCCTAGFLLDQTDAPSEEGLSDSTFNIAEAGCCQRSFLDGNLGQDPIGPVVASESTYTFGTGLDCCPGGPIHIDPESTQNLQEFLDLTGLCAGGCFEGECATQDCCRCDQCIDGFENSCVGAGSQSSCESLCSTIDCGSSTYVPNAMCTEDGSCASAAAAPAASPIGLVAIFIALVAIGGFAILGRRRGTSRTVEH